MHEFAIDSSNPSSSFQVIAPVAATEPNDETKHILNLNELIQNKIKANRRFFGIEISPAANGEDLDYRKFGDVQPLFTSITWLFDDNLKSDSLSTAPAVQLGKTIEKFAPILMHLTCYKLNPDKLREFLDLGFQNILALKGDSSVSSDSQRWPHAIDLVKAIRDVKTDITIGVAGYPKVHNLAKSAADDLQRLKAKVDAGANFIITNACFSFDNFVQFIRSCRAIGITVPIIPGIYVPTSYAALQKMCTICHIDIPADQMERFEQYKNDEPHFKAYAIENAQHLLTQLFTFTEHTIYGIQFFTLNKYDHIIDIVKNCEFVNK